MRNKKKVLLIGWDAADWNTIMPLVDAGKMPAMKKIIEGGIIGNIATLDPPLSPMLWTSIATGKYADKHGILGFSEPDAKTGSIRSVNSTSRTTRAIWNILHNQGYTSNVIGWWPSHPVEPIRGAMISNFYQRAKLTPGRKWSVVPGSVHPEALAKEIAPIRVHPAELTDQHILPFIPNAAKVDQKETPALETLTKIIADTATIHSTATYMMDNSEWDFTAVYFDGIDHFCHGFMKFHPPQLKHIPDDLFHLFKDVVNGAYIFHDMMLETYLNMVDDDTLIVLVSDHGFHSGALRPRTLPKLAAAPAMEHNPLGILCFYGPGIKKDERIYGASLIDVCPTILAALNLPVGLDMDGRVLDVFSELPEVNFIESWDKMEGDFGEHDDLMKEDVEASIETLQQLIDLGYIEDPGENQKAARENAYKENQYNLSRVLMSRRKTDEALDVLLKLYEQDSNDVRFISDLIQVYIAKGDAREARKCLSELGNLSDDNANKRFVNIDLLDARVLLCENKFLKAEARLRELLEHRPNSISLQKEGGKLFYNLGKINDSTRCFEKVLRFDPYNSFAFYGLARNCLFNGKYRDAADHALSSIGIVFHQPKAHYILGEALYHLGMYDKSVDAFELLLTMNEYHMNARSRLVEIYSKFIIDDAKRVTHEQFIEKHKKGTITVVSGLPHSGTSMMMQMLEAGGLETLHDIENSDTDNPGSNYEYEKVKSLPRNKSWLNLAEGKVLKVPAGLLKFLPKTYKYRIIIMQRDMREILRSQQIALKRDPDVYPMGLAESFRKELNMANEWLESQTNIDLIHVMYSSVIDNTLGSSSEINQFLDYQLNVSNMVNAIERSLCHNMN